MGGHTGLGEKSMTHPSPPGVCLRNSEQRGSVHLAKNRKQCCFLLVYTTAQLTPGLHSF